MEESNISIGTHKFPQAAIPPTPTQRPATTATWMTGSVGEGKTHTVTIADRSPEKVRNVVSRSFRATSTPEEKEGKTVKAYESIRTGQQRILQQINQIKDHIKDDDKNIKRADSVKLKFDNKEDHVGSKKMSEEIEKMKFVRKGRIATLASYRKEWHTFQGKVKELERTKGPPSAAVVKEMDKTQKKIQAAFSAISSTIPEDKSYKARQLAKNTRDLIEENRISSALEDLENEAMGQDRPLQQIRKNIVRLMQFRNEAQGDNDIVLRDQIQDDLNGLRTNPQVNTLIQELEREAQGSEKLKKLL